MVLAMTPLGVSAERLYYDKSSVVYLSGSNDTGSLYIGNLTSKQKIAKSSVKASGSAIRLVSLDKNSWSNQSDYFTAGMNLIPIPAIPTQSDILSKRQEMQKFPLK